MYTVSTSLDVDCGMDVFVLPSSSLDKNSDGQTIYKSPSFEYLFALACGAKILSQESFLKGRDKAPSSSDSFQNLLDLDEEEDIPDGVVVGDAEFFGVRRMLELGRRAKRKRLKVMTTTLFAEFNIFYYGMWEEEGRGEGGERSQLKKGGTNENCAGAGGGGEDEEKEEEDEDEDEDEETQISTSSPFKTPRKYSISSHTKTLALSMTENRCAKLVAKTNPAILQQLTKDTSKTPFATLSKTKIVLGSKSTSSDMGKCELLIEDVWCLDSDEIEIVGVEWIIDSLRDGKVQETHRYVK